jgi:hypothetical protein
MTRFKMIAFLFALGAQAALADDFWDQLTPEQRAAAGVEQLTPEQRAALNQLVGHFAKEGTNKAVAVAVEVAKEKAREEGRAEARAAAQEKKKATIGLAPREDDETEVIRAHISGDFRGWTGHTLFTLDNGQVWQQETPENRFFPKMVDPEIEIRPSRFGGWKMTLLKEGLWIRVKRVR